MKAAVLKAFGEPLTVMTVPAPRACPGEIVVDVRAAPVLPYAKQIFGGLRDYPLVPPMVPGCGAIAQVAEVGPDATFLSPGDWVFCDPTLRARDNAMTAEAALQGWDARGAVGAVLQQHFKDGPFAEKMRLPLENAVALGPIDPQNAASWSALNTLLIPYGGLCAIKFTAGESLLVSGANGHFGSATVAVALAMGASFVVVAGRDGAALDTLRARFGPRVRPVVLQGDPERDRARLMAAGDHAIDCVVDFLPPSADARAARAAIMSVRPHGRVVLMGGVGLQGGDDLALPYPWFMLNNITVRGQWMYSRADAPKLIALVRAGLLRLEEFSVSTYALDECNAAVNFAAETSATSAFRLTVITP